MKFACFFKPATLPDHAIIASDQYVIFDPPLFFAPETPHKQILASSGLSESCPTKNGDVPKSPFPTVAVLVPSAGTITLQIELHRMRVPKAPAPFDVRALLVARDPSSKGVSH